MGLGCWSSLVLVVACANIFWVPLSCFGHARAKNNSESTCWLELCSPFRLGLSPCCLYLLHRAVNCLFYYDMQWLVFGLLRVVLEAGYAWENWCWSHPDRVRLLDFFSTTLEEYLEGKLGPEGLWSRERTNSWCWVCGCLRSHVNSGVGVLSSPSRPPA